jgi:hypothetical protein
MDPLEVALITAHAAHMGAPAEIQAAFDMPRYHAARLWGLDRLWRGGGGGGESGGFGCAVEC